MKNTLLHKKIAHKRGGNDRGQGIVEFALVFPILIFIILGFIEFGIYFMTSHAVQSASRQTARMATTLIDLVVNDSRVLTFGNSLIPNSGPTAGFYGGITNSTADDCSVTDQITVTVQGDYNFIALKFLGLSSVHRVFSTTMHYELCPPFASEGSNTTVTAIVGSQTPSRTATATLTPSRTPTPTRTPTPSITSTRSRTPTATRTATITLTPSRTPTASRTPTRTATLNSPAAPVWEGGTYQRYRDNCYNLSFTWDASNSWSSNPGYGNSTYARYFNGNYYGSVAGNYPNEVTWNSGIDVFDNQFATLEIYAQFSGGITSLALEKTWRCVNGDMISQ